MAAKLKEIFAILAAILILILGWKELYRHDKVKTASIVSTVLPSDDEAKVIVNPAKHTVTVVTSGGSRTSYLPPHATAFEVSKAGAVKIDEQAYGTEISPFIGFAFSDTGRLALGVNLLFVHRWELGLSVFPTVSGSFSARVGPVVSYNVWSNTSLFVGVTDKLSPVGGLSVKF
jgi:hypothetical protein